MADEGDVPLPGGPADDAGTAESASPPPEAAQILAYIAACAAPAFEIDVEELKTALDASDAADVARRFASEPGASALYLRKEGRDPKNASDGTANLPNLPPSFSFVLSASPAFPPTLLATMIVIKRSSLSSLAPLPAQLQTITLGEGVNPYESLYGVVTGGVAPIFEAWSETGGGKGETDSKDRGSAFSLL